MDENRYQNGTKYGNVFVHIQLRKGKCELQQFLCVILPIHSRYVWHKNVYQGNYND